MLRLGLAAGLLTILLAWHVDWFGARQEWQQATGWAGIPPSLRPTSADLARGAPGSTPEIDWLGHSGFLIRWQGRTLLLDPNTSPWCTVSRRVLADPIDLGTIGPVDAALVSHPHFDHLDLPTLRSVDAIGTLVVPKGSASYVRDEGVAANEIVSLRVGESIRVGPLEVIAVEAEHNGNRFHPFESRRLAVGYVIRSAGFTLYYSGDTGLSDRFAAIREAYHPQAAILPIGAYLPRMPMKYYHLSPEEAVEAAVLLGVDTVIPCHFGTFTLSLDRPSWALPRFARAARARGVEWRMPRMPAPAEVRRMLVARQGSE